MHIRPFEPADTEALYAVCLRTGADGEDATGLYAEPTILGEVYVGPYLAFEPDSAWVVDASGIASAYVLGTPDTTAFGDRCEREWWPALRERYPVGTFPPGSLDDEVVGLIHDPPCPERVVLRDYPAHLHIDLVPEVQGMGFGSDLVRTLLDAHTRRGVPGIHLDVSTVNTRAIGFYEHLGFTTLLVARGSTIMGRRLDTV